METLSEHRSFQRVPFHQRIKVVSVGRVVAYAMAVNIGAGGVLLSSATPIPVGSQCRLAIPPSDGEGIKAIVTEGVVVRNDQGGIAIKFSDVMEPGRFEAMFRHSQMGILGSIVAGYQSYYQVSRSSDLADCERLLGVSKRTFRTTFYITFASCIFLAILPVWLFRNSIPAYPNWLKILLSFGWGGLWLAAIQPTVDLSVFQVIKHRHSANSNA